MWVLMAVAAFAQEAPLPVEARVAFWVGDEVSRAVGARVLLPRTGNLLMAQSALAVRRGQRWRFSASAAGLAVSHNGTVSRLRVKEAWFGLTMRDLDVSVGKKILRWSAGYAFTPAGVLDPPRNPADPTDRLDLNEGREVVAADYVRGRHALTAAWASAGLAARNCPGMRDTAAFRYNILLAGFDSSVVVAHDRGRRTFTGANFTRVFGEAWEVHGEFAHRDAAALLLGGKYATRCGVNTIGEFYSAPSEAGRARRQYAFVHAGKSRLRERPGWKEWDLGAALLVNLSDHSRIAILDVRRRFGNHLSASLRLEAPAGGKWRSEYGTIPYAAMVSGGLRLYL